MDEIAQLADDLALAHAGQAIVVVSDRPGCLTFADFLRLGTLVKERDPKIRLAWRAGALRPRVASFNA